MLPVTHGEAVHQAAHILLYTIVMIMVTILPYLIGMSNLFYLVSALALRRRISLYWSLIVTARRQSASAH